MSMLFFSILPAGAQVTLIPDATFELALIDEGYDTGVPDGSIPTDSIDGITSLYIDALGITDLTGIEDFTALEFLHSEDNLLSTIDLSQNLNLEAAYLNFNILESLDVSANSHLKILFCEGNSIPALDVSDNPLLEELSCGTNYITTIDVSANTVLKKLVCYQNPISVIDVSNNPALEELIVFETDISDIDLDQNPALKVFSCGLTDLTQLDLSSNSNLTQVYVHLNNLECLNIKNGNNANITNFDAEDNPVLTCIEVDDAAWSTTNWTMIDAGASFSTFCPNACSSEILATPTKTETVVNVYPNPTSTGLLNVQGIAPGTAYQVTNTAGQLVLSGIVTAAQIDISALENGIYILTMIVDDAPETIRVSKY